MAEEIVKTIENIDRLFSEIEINGTVYKSGKVQEASKPVKIPVQPVMPLSDIQTQGENVRAVDLNNVLHNIEDTQSSIMADYAVQQALIAQASVVTEAEARHEEITNLGITINASIQNEATERQNADATLQDNIDTVQGNVNTVQGDVNDIKALIPETTTAENKLADQGFVNSSIATNTAYFKGTFNTLEEIQALTDVTNNDYAFWRTTDSLGAVVYKRYKYNAEEGQWVYEYDLNNSSFTAEQWATINSGITVESLESDLAKKVDIAQGSENAGKVLKVGENGDVVLGEGLPSPSKASNLLISVQTEEGLEWQQTDESNVGGCPTLTQQEYDDLPETEKTDSKLRAVADTTAISLVEQSRLFISNVPANVNLTIQDAEITSHFEVLLLNGHYGLTFTINNKRIYVAKDGQLVEMSSHNLNRGDGAKDWYVQPNTTLEFIYLDSLDNGNGGFLIKGNPVVLSKSSDSEGYTVYADGLIEQWQEEYLNSGYGTHTYAYLIPFTTDGFYLDYQNIGNNDNTPVTESFLFTEKYKTYFIANKTKIRTRWYAKGY